MRLTECFTSNGGQKGDWDVRLPACPCRDGQGPGLDIDTGRARPGGEVTQKGSGVNGDVDFSVTSGSCAL
jgi:hypothetical protein